MNRYFILIFAILQLLFSCRSEQSRVAAEAEEDGINHAISLIKAQPMGEMQLQNLVFEVRSNAEKLRESGYEKAAETYLSSFEKTIREECDSLAGIIF